MIEYLIIPPGSALVLLVAGLLVLLRWRLPGLGLILLGVVTLYLASVPVVAYALIRSLETRFSPVVNAAHEHPAQAIVVLGAGRNLDALEYGGDTVNCMALQRLRYAAHLSRETGLPVLVAGGRVHDEPQSEAYLAARILEDEFKVTVRWSEEQSRNTYENALYSARILHESGVERVLLVTHAFHMPRAVWSFRRHGLQVEPAPTGFSNRDPLSRGGSGFLPQARALLLTRLYLHEWLGLLWYRLRYG